MEEREAYGTVTRKGQVTIPLRIRRLLRIGPNDRVVFHTEEGRVYLTAVRETLESAFGAVAPLNRPEDFESLRSEAVDEQAAKIVREMRGCEEDSEP